MRYVYDSVGRDLHFCIGERNVLKDTWICLCAFGDILCEEILYVLRNATKKRNKPKHHSSYFSAGVLCKSNWVENSAPASYFCSKNALSKVMRTVFEVAPAGKYSRRLCVCPPPQKSLCSLLIAASPKSRSLTVFTQSLTKAAGVDVRMKGWEGRKEGGKKVGGWKKEGELESHRLNVNIVTFQGREVLPAAVFPWISRSFSIVNTAEPSYSSSSAYTVCIHLINPHLNCSTLYLLFYCWTS